MYIATGRQAQDYSAHKKTIIENCRGGDDKNGLGIARKDLLTVDYVQLSRTIIFTIQFS